MRELRSTSKDSTCVCASLPGARTGSAVTDGHLRRIAVGVQMGIRRGWLAAPSQHPGRSGIIRVAIVGLGQAGAFSLEALRDLPGVSVAGAVDPSPPPRAPATGALPPPGSLALARYRAMLPADLRDNPSVFGEELSHYLHLLGEGAAASHL
jgi:hypothetical protein